ncbi:MAG: NUDIX domain-containing protein [Sneathiella sp.]|uniref:NUDIX hydrolase n=1 Tax=Sneathiella sp. TaxID=1964365 RepID=UPI00300119CF
MEEISNVLLVRNRKLLLGLRSGNRKRFPDCWAAPGGHLETNETPLEAARREMSEELGVVVKELTQLSPIHLSSTTDPIKFHMFAAFEWLGGEPSLKNHEHSKLAWFSFDEARLLQPLALEEYRLSFLELELL